MVIDLFVFSTGAYSGAECVVWTIAQITIDGDFFVCLFFRDDVDHAGNSITAIETTLTSFEDLDPFYHFNWNISDVEVAAYTSCIVYGHTVDRDQCMFNPGSTQIDAFIFSGISVSAIDMNTSLFIDQLW